VSTSTLVDTSDMVRFHRVFREAFATAPRLVASVAPGDTHRAQLVADYYVNVLRLLHAHHTGEDELLMPKLLERYPDPEVVRAVAEQHEGVGEGLTSAEAALTAFRVRPAPETAAPVITALDSLGTALIRHLDDEERILLPIAARYVTQEEWAALPENGLRHFDGDRPWLVLGLIRRHLTRAEVEEMDAHMSPPPGESGATSGWQDFAAFMAELGA
jgi:iron-sulfur cluster repair protein YtfE (RIC family)